MLEKGHLVLPGLLAWREALGLFGLRVVCMFGVELLANWS